MLHINYLEVPLTAVVYPSTVAGGQCWGDNINVHGRDKIQTEQVPICSCVPVLSQ